jgi:hypothetical protein
MATTGSAPLNLTKPEAADVVSLSVINNNYDIINANAASVATSLSTQSGQISTLNTKMTTVEGQLAGVGAAWVSYAPTLGGGLASGFSVNSAFYGRLGKTVLVRGVLACAGATGSGLTFTLPVEAKAPVIMFDGVATKAGGNFPLFASVATASGVSTVTLHVLSTGSAYGSRTALSSSVPATWTVDDSISFTVIYEGV